MRLCLESPCRTGRSSIRCGPEETGGGLTIEVGGEGVTESSAGSREVVAGKGGLGVEESTAGDVDEPGAGAHRSEHGVVDEGWLPGLIPGRDEDGVDVG